MPTVPSTLTSIYLQYIQVYMQSGWKGLVWFLVVLFCSQVGLTNKKVSVYIQWASSS